MSKKSRKRSAQGAQRETTYAAANLFLSNFTEEHFDRDWYQAGGFDSTDGLSDDEKYKLV